ncbi:PREDICTED: uncharacterized protein LOC109183383 [Ipomoea nil]|uniref:uncharacterized protein LOC109183383 n=1 Tax=Ipomoea nil TaxID=35883 RepID=UPI000901F27A|nr:PREDICTED: uncharacterized protein LOC109183383 [Ipomoea nil]
MPEGLNASNVVLIPKKTCLEHVYDLRPIALCNVAYKVLAKIVANRLKEILDTMISPSQNAFIPYRLITYNIIVAGELGHYLRVKYNIVVNGDDVGSVMPTREEARGNIHGIRVARTAPPVSHLFFADDSMLLFKATAGEAQKVQECLSLYNRVSGQAVNYAKSSIMFSANTVSGIREQVAAIFGVQQVDDFGRVCTWQKKLLSRAGKEVLLNSVAQSMPIFAMSMFLLPKSVCDSIEKVMNHFWWKNGTTNGRGIHWTSWLRLAIPKKFRGMGFKRLQEFNIALLAKKGWRIITRPHSLLSWLLKAKYFPTVGFLEARIGHNPSYLWRSILASQELLHGGLIRRVGDGKDTLVWGQACLADASIGPLTTPCARDAKVCQLMTSDGTWDLEVKTVVASTQNSNHEFTEWGRLWRIPVRPKVINLIWRCTWGILPVREKLKTKGIWIGGGCPLCTSDIEIIEHLFGDCPVARQLWGVDDILHRSTFAGFMNSSFRMLPQTSMVLIAARIWVIWNTRNNVVLHDKNWTIEGLTRQMTDLSSTWLDSLLPMHGGRRRMDSELSLWMPPPKRIGALNATSTQLFLSAESFMER